MRHFVSSSRVARLSVGTMFQSEYLGEIASLQEKIQKLENRAASDALVNLHASRRALPLSVKESLKVFGDEAFHPAIFCHKHLPITLAHFIKGLDNLPKGLNAMSEIRKVRQTLLDSFSKLMDCALPISSKESQIFFETLESIEEAHAARDLLQTIASGILELKDHISQHRRALVDLKRSDSRWSSIHLTEMDVLPFSELAVIQEPLDFCNRCMITYNFLSRMLLNSHQKDDERIGMIDLKLNLEKVVRGAIDDAKQICTDHYGDCPDVNIQLVADSEELRFPFVSTTVRYIVLELMKNAFRATVEAHMKKNEMGIVTCTEMPPISVLITLINSTEHACIRISDEGRGMTQQALEMAMAYTYTSVSTPALRLKQSEAERDCSKSVVETSSPLAGYGYGLPMSRIYAEVFGGDLVLQTMEGYGTRAYYYLKLN